MLTEQAIYLSYQSQRKKDRYTGLCVISFPTKHHWKKPSELGLVKRSANHILHILKHLSLPMSEIWLPPVGCGLGGLSWKEEVEPALSFILDDRFTVIFKE